MHDNFYKPTKHLVISINVRVGGVNQFQPSSLCPQVLYSKLKSSFQYNYYYYYYFYIIFGGKELDKKKKFKAILQYM